MSRPGASAPHPDDEVERTVRRLLAQSPAPRVDDPAAVEAIAGILRRAANRQSVR